MNRNEVHELAERIVRESLGSLGVERVEIEERLDQDDEEALFVTATLTPSDKAVEGRISAKAVTALRNALLDNDEQRFPYLTIRHSERQRDAISNAASGS